MSVTPPTGPSPLPPRPVAHSPRPGEATWHDLMEHLREVADLAARFAAPFGGESAASLVGWWHDAGKLHPDWQAGLVRAHRTGGRVGLPHADVGMAALVQHSRALAALALLIAGHHTGLASQAELKDKLAAAGRDARVQEAIRRAHAALDGCAPLPAAPSLPGWALQDAPRAALFLRLAHSALVDADCTDTEAWGDPDAARLRRMARPGIEALRELLAAAVEARMAAAPPSRVNQHRAVIYRDAVAAAAMPPGAFSLTVPTGGGKTLSGMAFALEHAARHGLRRVIVALPYTSIIEQTAEVYREIFGADAVLEHHSALDGEARAQQEEADGKPGEENERRRRLAAQSWDAPIIVTTTVQLLESLYACRNSALRKLHNIPSSVILLDEVQTLPPEVLAITLDGLNLLTEHLGCSVVLSTATQPALREEAQRGAKTACGLRGVREIVQAPQVHFEALRRVTYARLDEALGWEALAERAAAHAQGLVILNTVRDAQALVRAAAALRAPGEVLHLSTRLCGAHRREVLAAVRERLRQGQPCLLVATQVVEAGVDLDFPAVFRAFGPLDSLVQAAGRCNREGRRPDAEAVVWLFEPAEGTCPPGVYRAARDRALEVLGRHPLEALHTASIFTDYFARLYGNLDLDRPRLREAEGRLDFPAVAQGYRLIPEETTPVLVRRPQDAARVDPLVADIARWGLRGHHMRALQPFLVSLRRHTLRRFCQQGLATPLSSPGGDAELLAWCGGYDDLLGLTDHLSPDDLILV